MVLTRKLFFTFLPVRISFALIAGDAQMFSLINSSLIEQHKQEEWRRLEGKHLNVILGQQPIVLQNGRGEKIRTRDLNDLFLETLKWMSKRFSFTYTLLTTSGMRFDATSNSPGVVAKLVNGESDLVINTIVLTPKRFQLVDFPHPWFIDPMVLVIPNPLLTTNIGAVWNPFQFPVWILTAFSLVIVFAALHFLNNSNIQSKEHFREPFRYVVGTILNQGTRCSSGKLHFRLVTGTWCLSAFVLVNIYNCTLMSHLFAPNYNPLIRSIYDIVEQKHIQILVRENYGIDAFISSAENGILKHLADKMRTYPKSRCFMDRECLDLVKMGSHVFLTTEVQALSAIAQDVQSHGRCEFAFIKEDGWEILMSFAAPKNGSFIEEINRGVLNMREVGLTDEWLRWYKPTFNQCPIPLNGKKFKSKKSDEFPLTVKNLTGAFVVLGIGCVLSFVCFISEVAWGAQSGENLFCKSRQKYHY